MARYMLIALNGPAGEAAESRYNQWYDDTHLPELLAIEGVTSARRFKAIQGNAPWPYFAAYEIETDDLEMVMKGMSTTVAGIPAEFDREKSANILAIEINKE